MGDHLCKQRFSWDNLIILKYFNFMYKFENFIRIIWRRGFKNSTKSHSMFQNSGARLFNWCNRDDMWSSRGMWSIFVSQWRLSSKDKAFDRSAKEKEASEGTL